MDIRHQQNHGGSCLKLNYATRNETFRGKPYLVAPVVILTEGVHAGSQGPLYYPREELRNFPPSWNGIPLPINHPDINGAPTIANSPETIDRLSVGQLFAVRYDESTGIGRLMGELWVDIEKAQEIAPEVLQRLRANQPLEVSTGLYSQDEIASGDWHGEPYQLIARNYRPEHLALLPDNVGACSIADGCGVRNQQKKDDEMRQKQRNAPPKNNSEKEPQKYMSESLLTNEGMVELRDKLQAALDSLDVFGSNSAVHFLREFMPHGDTGGRVIARIHRENEVTTDEATYTVNGSGQVTIGTFSAVVERTSFDPVTNTDEGKIKKNKCEGCNCGGEAPNNLNDEDDKGTSTNNEEGVDEMKTEKAEQVTSMITANVGFSEKHRVCLEGLECDVLGVFSSVVEQVETLTKNAVKKPTTVEEAMSFLPDSEKMRVNEALKIEGEKRKALVEGITANTKNPFTAPELQGMTIERLEGLSSFAATVEEKPIVPVIPVNNYAGAAGAVTENIGTLTTNKEGEGPTGLSTPQPMEFK